MSPRHPPIHDAGRARLLPSRDQTGSFGSAGASPYRVKVKMPGHRPSFLLTYVIRCSIGNRSKHEHPGAGDDWSAIVHGITQSPHPDRYVDRTCALAALLLVNRTALSSQ